MTLDDFVGQDELVGEGKLLATLIQSDRVPSMILWGPPGCGKTTLAHIISKRTGSKFLTLSGATSNMADMRDAIDKARGERKLLGRHTIVFVDEIHRFKKNQQDFFLPPVEDGTITLIGATTENPSFEINNALLSRCRVYTLQKHSLESIRRILDRAIASQNDAYSGTESRRVEAEDDALTYLANQCGGDARVALNCLELAVQTTLPLDGQHGVLRVTCDHVKHCFANRQTLFYDRNADFHYDLISAFHKSVRGSDDSAALYWLARMLEGGENPLYIARRMIRIAAEDVGLAAPHLVEQAVAAYHAAHFIGMPECDVVLAQCATLLARAPKSVEVYKTYKRVKHMIHEWDGGAQPDVPMHLRNAPTRLMKTLGYGDGYKYNPDFTEEETKDQTYLPAELVGRNFFTEEGT
jgi:putative ATPase